MKYALRLMTFQDVLDETPFKELPVAFVGTQDECLLHAMSKGYVWMNKRNAVLGGYWYCKAKSRCLMPDSL